MSGLSQRFFTVVGDAMVWPLVDLAGDFVQKISIPVGSKNNETDERIFIENTGFSTTILNGITISILLFILYLIYLTVRKLNQWLFVPLDRVRRLGDIGYINHEAGDLSRKEVANLMRQRRKMGQDIPPVYPNGWFRVIDSVQLRRKEVKQVHAMGLNFAVFRGQSGKVTVMDAYCAHMGGNLAAGGRVLGDCLECPFHGWVYNDEGKVVRIPYTSKVPSIAKTKVWPSREVNGVVFVWYHCDNIEPQWEIPTIPEIKQGSFYYRGRVEHHVNTHIQDIPENGSDLAHLSHLHVPSVFCGVNLAEQFDSWFNFADHIFKVDCKGSDDDLPHISKFDMTHHLEFFKKWKFFHIDLQVEQIGPGIVHLHMNLPFARSVLVQSLTPVGPLHQVIIHSFYTDWKCPTWLSKIFLTFEAIQVDRDVMVWNNKTFSAKPLLVKEEAPITKYRRWFSQFYSENSPKFNFKSNDDVSW
uniref:cholesterol 7-desaturase nvd-like n=1 Tax=Styela clava TaxID=7725 RepID=UPI001939ADD7|nr:cholesterol 7-desaturase nvd-like [Styela clava]